MSTEAPIAKAPKRARGVQRVAELLDAGAALFTKNGYETTTMTQIAKRAPGLSPLRVADRLIDLMLNIRSDRDAMAALSGSVSGIVERRKSLRGATRRQIAAILRAANPKLREKAAAEAAAMIAHVLKLVPTLAKEEEDGGQALVAQVRKMLAAYIERVVRQ